MPFAPSAPTIASAGHALAVDASPCSPARSPTFTPSRTSTPRSRAASSRNSSRRAPLRHPDHRLFRLVHDRRAVAEAQLDLVDELLDHRRRVDRALADGAQRHPAAARLVPREHRLVGEEHGGALLGEPIRGRRASRSAPDDDRVVVLHRQEATMPGAPGGVPERPKGTGCKPVGSAYGGSNPPAPTVMLARAWKSCNFRARLLRLVVSGHGQSPHPRQAAAHRGPRKSANDPA